MGWYPQPISKYLSRKRNVQAWGVQKIEFGGSLWGSTTTDRDELIANKLTANQVTPISREERS